EVDGTGNVAGGVPIRRPKVDDKGRLRVRQLRGESGSTHQEVRIRVSLRIVWHGRHCTRGRLGRTIRLSGAVSPQGCLAMSADRARTHEELPIGRLRGWRPRVRPGESHDDPASPLNLDKLIHERLRLGIVTALAAHDKLSFNDLKA